MHTSRAARPMMERIRTKPESPHRRRSPCSIVSGRSVRNASVPGRIRGAKGRPAWHAGGVEAAGIRSFRRSSSTRYARPILAAELGRPRRALAIERDLAAARAQWWELLEEFTARAQELGVQRHT